MKSVKRLPTEMIRVSDSYQSLDEKFEERFKMAQSASMSFEHQSTGRNTTHSHSTTSSLAPKWTFEDEKCLQHLLEMRKYEDEMMMFQDEKIELLRTNIESLESYVTKMTRDLNEFRSLLQPNLIKLPFPRDKVAK